jgi:hypothetical protein
MTNSTFKMVNVSSYGSKIIETVVLENATIECVKQKYFEMAGNYLGVIFDRNFKDNSKHFTLPYSYNSIHVYEN